MLKPQQSQLITDTLINLAMIGIIVYAAYIVYQLFTVGLFL